MPSDPSPSERRIEELGREAFELAVVTATKAATQEVAKIHRVRLVTQASLASLLVALLVAAGVAYALSQDQAAANYANALSNCHLVKRLSRPLADFVGNDAQRTESQLRVALRDQAYLRGLNRLFGKTEVARLEAISNGIDRDSIHYWTTSVVPRLNAVAGADCVVRLH